MCMMHTYHNDYITQMMQLTLMSTLHCGLLCIHKYCSGAAETTIQVGKVK